MKKWRKKDEKYRAIILCNLLDNLTIKLGGLAEMAQDITANILAMFTPTASPEGESR